jgi:hypothetical protein
MRKPRIEYRILDPIVAFHSISFTESSISTFDIFNTRMREGSVIGFSKRKVRGSTHSVCLNGKNNIEYKKWYRKKCEKSDVTISPAASAVSSSSVALSL